MTLSEEHLCRTPPSSKHSSYLTTAVVRDASRGLIKEWGLYESAYQMTQTGGAEGETISLSHPELAFHVWKPRLLSLKGSPA